MKALLAKVALHKAIGLHLGEHEASVSKVAGTLVGPTEVYSATEPYTSENIDEVLERLLTPLLDSKQRLPVAVGLCSSKLFFSTRLVSAGGTSTPESILQKSLCSTNICIDDLTVDMIRGDVNKSSVASVTACRKRYLSSVVATLSRLGVRPLRVEPSPHALVRLAGQINRFPRRSKTFLCIFLGETSGIAVVMGGGMPLAWRTFTLPKYSESFNILSAARSLQTQEKHYGIESSLDYAIVHGREDLQEELKKEGFPSEIGTRVLWRDGPSYNSATMAYALALGGIKQNVAAFDLSQNIKARASLREIFPWADLAFTGALVGVMGFILQAHSMHLDESLAELQAQSTQYKCLASAESKGNLTDLEKDLEQKVTAVQKFLETRILWSAYTHDVSERLPKNATMNLFQGKNALDCRKKKGATGPPKKSFLLRAQAPCEQDGSMPHDIDAFLNSIKNHPLLKRDFASVEVSEIKRAQSRASEIPRASFSIVCLPEKKGAKTSKSSDKDKEH